MSGSEFSSWLDGTGIKAVEVADRFDKTQSTVNSWRYGRTDIPEEIVSVMVTWGDELTKARAEYAQSAKERFAPLVAVSVGQ